MTGRALAAPARSKVTAAALFTAFCLSLAPGCAAPPEPAQAPSGKTASEKAAGDQPAGDQAASKAASEKDPQAAYEPLSKPGDGQKFLQRFVGDWTVTKTFQRRSGDPVSTQGQCRQSMIHDGRFLTSEFAFENAGSTTTGLGIIGFEAASSTFTSFWTDSRSTRISIRRSETPFNGEEIVLFSQTLGAEKETRRSRTSTRIEDGDRKIVHRQYSATPDGGERLVMELVLTRKEAPPAH